MADVLQNQAGLEPVGGNLSPMVEVTLLERPGGGVRLLHLVNGSGNLDAGWVEPVTMRDVEVAFPHVGEPSEVRSLVTDRELPWHVGDARLTVRIPELNLFEAIRITAGRPDRA